ncbi:hypothetical protein F4818DRAFT_411877 [Hypoxylon cercidicola]|nr:hypothetical protein F4818DRAFT_411877 [Hypoxylon cercidicola]
MTGDSSDSTDSTDSTVSTETIHDYVSDQELGYFEPAGENEKHTGVHYDMQIGALVFTEVNCFVSHLNVFRTNHHSYPNDRGELVRLFAKLFRGSAESWWSDELTDEDRWLFHTDPEGLIMDLREHFGRDQPKAS